MVATDILIMTVGIVVDKEVRATGKRPEVNTLLANKVMALFNSFKVLIVSFIISDGY
jgi:hypothetical protein